MTEILDLRYFGSIIRSDYDVSSDVDVLCVSEDGASIDARSLLNMLDSNLVAGRHVDISYYGVARIREMWLQGHLFAWHIYLGSKLVAEDYSFIQDLGRPAPYTSGLADIQQLVSLVEDVSLSLRSGSVSFIYEAGLLYVAARNIGICASWYSDNGLNFSRLAPFSLAYHGELLSPNISLADYSLLSEARHASMRGASAPELQGVDLVGLCDRLLEWSSRVFNIVEVLK